MTDGDRGTLSAEQRRALRDLTETSRKYHVRPPGEDGSVEVVFNGVWRAIYTIGRAGEIRVGGSAPARLLERARRSLFWLMLFGGLGAIWAVAIPYGVDGVRTVAYSGLALLMALALGSWLFERLRGVDAHDSDRGRPRRSSGARSWTAGADGWHTTGRGTDDDTRDGDGDGD